MDLIQESFQRLFPDKPFPYTSEIEYNLRLAPFNANISLHHEKIKLHLNLQWKDIDDEIKIGLIQHLLCKILKTSLNTANTELYHNFIRNIPSFAPKTKTSPELESSFRRINQQFFSGQLEQPNLRWGQPARRKLASYNFHNDLVTVSSLFQDAPPSLLDYLMYHELLHKHHRFHHKNGRSSFHFRDFRNDESLYPNQKDIDLEIEHFLRSKVRIARSKKSSLWNLFRIKF